MPRMTRKTATSTDPKKPAARKRVAGTAARKAAAKAPANPFKINSKEWNREKVMDAVCNAIASSSKSITTILAAGHQGHPLPDYATVARWLNEKDENGANPICDQYARAKEAQAEFMAEELAELHNKAWVPVLDPDTGMPIVVDGRPLMTVDKASAAIVRLEADNKKWLMGKLKPRRFGDKVTQEHVGEGGGPIKARIAVEFVRPPARSEDDES
ncbi:hypothetical protein AC731_006530 [Thauera humireducens]|uniref:Terminase small subunit n=2 Tax=Thauera humireducens TaxID=1134435 RepID=A0A127K495_9RHOO|nr:hypothetical protein AC731_005425 [Thauera humireducens]AMO36627.1 hypothetical protein AC731_006530 [Thauera humireducens]